jgi:ribosome assembly protein 3
LTLVKKSSPQVAQREIKAKRKTKTAPPKVHEVLAEEDREGSIDQEIKVCITPDPRSAALSNVKQDTRQDSLNQDFTSWYLRKVTQELEDDLDKIRGSGDFNETSLPVLINALQQGETIFSAEEKRRIVGRP